jgi:hypothetical protein
MTNFNTDYNNNTELLDQELMIEQLEGVWGARWDGAPEQFRDLGNGVIVVLDWYFN